MITSEGFLNKVGIQDRILNKEDLPEYWLKLSDLLKEFAVIHVDAALKAAEKEVNAGLEYVYPLKNIN